MRATLWPLWLFLAAMLHTGHNTQAVAHPVLPARNNQSIHNPPVKSNRPRRRSPYYHKLLCPPEPQPHIDIVADEHAISHEVESGPKLTPSMPQFWVRIGIAFFLLLIAALMSGLTIGFFSIDCNTLTILKQSGDARQRKYAAIVEPLRKNSHTLLCTLLLGNMLANEAMPIVIDDLLAGGWQSVIVSTALVVIFGEIIPQAICAQFGLAVGAHTAWLVKMMMFIFYPIAWPIGKVLTLILGDHDGFTYGRAQLKELVTLHAKQQPHDLAQEEVEIIRSVLDLRSKTVMQVSTLLS